MIRGTVYFFPCWKKRERALKGQSSVLMMEIVRTDERLWFVWGIFENKHDTPMRIKPIHYLSIHLSIYLFRHSAS